VKINHEQVNLRTASAGGAVDPVPGAHQATRESASTLRESEDALAPGRVLYLSFDGVLEPLGRSQVLSYLAGLSQRGYSFTLISLEKAQDLSDHAAVLELEAQLSKRNIRWVRLPYQTGGIKSVLRNCSAVYKAARRVIKQERVQVTHCRSYVAALVGWSLRRLYGIPYIFDMRGYWIDELRDEGRWFNNALAYRVGKLMERRLVKDSSAIVTLTGMQAEDLRRGLLKKQKAKPIEVITTCADYDEFDSSLPIRGAIPRDLLERLEGKLTVGFVGSINTSYALSESLSLFRYLLEERADAHLICLTRQTIAMKALLTEHRIPESAYTLASVDHREMPEWLRRMDWALLLLNTRFSKRGSMPTKLAEFFAAGVRPIQHGCNAEVSEKVREAGSGIVLKGLSQEELREAARRIAAMPTRGAEVLRAREISRAHFSLAAGVEKYEKLLAGFYPGGSQAS
jgi:glycosyltransferase involved in cell wall biosynthesis